jgi:hypothetical protein
MVWLVTNDMKFAGSNDERVGAAGICYRYRRSSQACAGRPDFRHSYLQIFCVQGCWVFFCQNFCHTQAIAEN